MALKYTLDNMEGIEENIQSLYKEENGSYKLQVLDVVSKSDFDSVKQQLVDANEEAVRRRKSNERWQELGKSPDVVKELLNSKAQPSEDQERIISEVKEGYEAKIKAADERVNNLNKKQAVNELRVQLAAQNVITAGIEPLTLMARDRISFDEDGNARIMAKDNTKPLAGSGANGYATISDLAKELVASETGQHFVKDDGVSGGGKPPASQGSKPFNQSVNRQQFDAMSHRERSQFAKDGGKVFDT